MRLCIAMLPNYIGGCRVVCRGRGTPRWGRHHGRNEKETEIEWRKEGREMREGAESNADDECKSMLQLRAPTVLTAAVALHLW
jgi:hypothetical protein